MSTTPATFNPALDPKAFRAALGAFATGVTVITTQGRNGQPIGLTANSFNSVSLDPPMVLWSLAKKAYSLGDFQQASHWAVHVLAADQEAISNQFARAGEDKFAGVTLDPSEHQVPLLQGCSARFECVATHQYDGGDHIIFVGTVTRFQHQATPPLVFHAGKYALATLKGDAFNTPAATEAEDAQGFRGDMLGYLLGRARRHFLDGMRPHLEPRRLTDYEWRVLTMVLSRQTVTAELIGVLNKDVDLVHIRHTLKNLQHKGWLRTTGPDVEEPISYVFTEKGLMDSVHLLDIAKTNENRLMELMGPVDGALLKSLLRKFIAQTDQGDPTLWDDVPKDVMLAQS